MFPPTHEMNNHLSRTSLLCDNMFSLKTLTGVFRMFCPVLPLCPCVAGFDADADLFVRTKSASLRSVCLHEGQKLMLNSTNTALRATRAVSWASRSSDGPRGQDPSISGLCRRKILTFLHEEFFKVGAEPPHSRTNLESALRHELVVPGITEFSRQKRKVSSDHYQQVSQICAQTLPATCADEIVPYR